MLFLAFHVENHFHVLWKLSYFDAYDWTSLKYILLSQTLFSSNMPFYKIVKLVMKTFLCMHFDICYFDSQNVLVQMQYIRQHNNIM